MDGVCEYVKSETWLISCTGEMLTHCKKLNHEFLQKLCNKFPQHLCNATVKNDLDFLRNLQKAFEDGADIDVDHEADIAGHTPLSYDDPRAVCWSIEGAVWLAAKKKGLAEELEEILLCRICASIIETDYIYTTPTVDTLDKYLIMDLFISEWNDMYDRTKEEVLSILKAAQIQGGADEG